jgi:hypothetical protein
MTFDKRKEKDEEVKSLTQQQYDDLDQRRQEKKNK